MTLHSLQAGRAFAAVAVFLFHLSLMLKEARYGGEATFELLTTHLNRGVDFFFVLSGFIILYAHRKDINDPSRLTRYLRNRFLRLFPIYWVYTFGFCALLWLGFGGNTSLEGGTLYWLQTITLVRLTDASTPLEVAWTLFHEVGFYLIFATLIIRRELGLALLFAWLVLCLWNFSNPPEDGRHPLAVYTALYNVDFFFGMAACLLFTKLDFVRAGAMAVAGSFGLATCYYLLYTDGAGQGISLGLGLSFGLLICAMAAFETQGAFTVPRWLSYVGSASYTIYLIHVPVQGVLLKVAMKLPFLRDHGELRFAFVTIFGLIACIVAYRLVEANVMSILRPKNVKNKAILSQV